MILITGCDHGLAVDLVKQCIDNGYTVLATCLTTEGCTHLQQWYNTYTHTRHRQQQHDSSDTTENTNVNSNVNVHVNDNISLYTYELDIRNESQMKYLFDNDISNILYSRQYHGIYALINNAAMNQTFLFDFLSTDDYQQHMDVNVLGTIRVIKYALPFLKQYNEYYDANDDDDTNSNSNNAFTSRILIISSFLGTLSAMSLSAYSMTKYALESLIVSLRQELLYTYKIHVISIQPGTMRTPMIDAYHDGMQRIFDAPQNEHLKHYEYGVGYQRIINIAYRMMSLLAQHPCHTASAIVHSLNARSPYKRYVVGWDAKLMVYTYPFIPSWLYDWLVLMVIRPPTPLAMTLQNRKNSTDRKKSQRLCN